MRLPNIFRRAKSSQIPFASDEQMQRIAPLADEFCKNILFDEEPAFISDEATIWDISLGPNAQELKERCVKFYGVEISDQDLKKSLWVLIEHLNKFRIEKRSI